MRAQRSDKRGAVRLSDGLYNPCKRCRAAVRAIALAASRSARTPRALAQTARKAQRDRLVKAERQSERRAPRCVPSARAAEPVDAYRERAGTPLERALPVEPRAGRRQLAKARRACCRRDPLRSHDVTEKPAVQVVEPARVCGVPSKAHVDGSGGGSAEVT